MRLSMPAIGYYQGRRRMAVTAMSPTALVKTVQRPRQWNPLGKQPHGNRPEDRAHRAGIADYLEEEEQFVLGSVVLYASPGEAEFVPIEGQADADHQVGTLFLDVGASFDVGDGQHRLGAYSDVINRHIERGDEVMERLHRSGQPVIVVIDDDPLHRAQDFTDLQRNAKPPTASLSQSMDRRQAVNRLLVGLIQHPDLPIFANGDRVEFLTDTVGKLSPKIATFKAVRHASGLALGINDRTVKTWDRKVNDMVRTEGEAVTDYLTAFWGGLDQLPDFAKVIKGEWKVAGKGGLRERTYLTSSGVLYAIAWAANLAYERKDIYPDAFLKALGEAVSFARPGTGSGPDGTLTATDTVFCGNLVDSATGRITGAQAAWEDAAEALLFRVYGPDWELLTAMAAGINVPEDASLDDV